MIPIGVITGTFDPPTKGHIALISFGSKCCKKLSVVVSTNQTKIPLFTAKERAEFLKIEIKDRKLENVEVEITENPLNVHIFEMTSKPNVLIRGIRNLDDYEYDMKHIINKNKKKFNEYDIQVIFVPEQKLEYTSSTLLKKRIVSGDVVSDLASERIVEALRARMALLLECIRGAPIPDGLDSDVVDVLSKKVAQLKEKVRNGDDTFGLLTISDLSYLPSVNKGLRC